MKRFMVETTDDGRCAECGRPIRISMTTAVRITQEGAILDLKTCGPCVEFGAACEKNTVGAREDARG